MNYTVCLPAAGRGSRTHLHYNKVFYKLPDGQTILEKTLALFLADPDCREVLIAAGPEEIEIVKELVGRDPRVKVTAGGKERQESVYNLVREAHEDYVLIHDAARPYLDSESLERLKAALENEPACLLAIPAVDTVKIAHPDGTVASTPDRSLVWQAQTPQAFSRELILDCHEKARQADVLATDDAQLVELFGQVPVKLVMGSPANLKITRPEDLQ